MPQARCTALVTGASQGLGAAIALELARDGFDVAITELTLAPLARSVAAIEAVGARAHAVELDVRSQASYITGQTLVLDGGLTSY